MVLSVVEVIELKMVGSQPWLITCRERKKRKGCVVRAFLESLIPYKV